MPILILKHEVQDYAAWKPHFDKGEDLRKRLGIQSLQVGQDAENPNLITIISQIDSHESVAAMAENQELRETMAQGGVIGKPEMSVMNEIHSAQY